jgi:hypothetical protein
LAIGKNELRRIAKEKDKLDEFDETYLNESVGPCDMIVSVETQNRKGEIVQ